MQAYYDYQVGVALTFYAGNRINTRERMGEALDFEIELAKISKASEDRRNLLENYQEMTIGDFVYKYNSEITWLEYFNELLDSPRKLTDSDSIAILNVEYFEKVISKIDIDVPRQPIANYVNWRVVMSAIDYLEYPQLRTFQQEFHENINGKTARTERWEECVDQVMEVYPHSLSALYVREHFRDEVSKTLALEMVENIKEELKANIGNIEWMDQETKAWAIAKLDAMKAEIGYAEELTDDDKLSSFYEDFPEISDEEDFFEMIHKLKAAATVRRFSKIHDDIVEKEWFDHQPPLDVKGFYSFLENLISFPAGLLQGGLFNPERPMYLNYGSVGVAISREIVQGFDDQGSQFNANGNLENWWSDHTEEQFSESARCFTEQYSSFTEPQTDQQINGLRTRYENIADHGGVKLAYRAYTKWVADNHREPPLAELELTPNQLFWISFGQMWCSVSKEPEMRNILRGDHAPPQFRVWGSIMNSAEFSRDFNCSPNSSMDPEEKCEIW